MTGRQDVENNRDAAAPWTGLRVLDASRVLAGPFCGAILADLGAEVIRVEHPTQIDETRIWSPVVDGISGAFAAVNHSKQSIAVDLAAAQGKEVFKRLAATADVLIENYRPGTLERFGLGWSTLHAINPRLIHCSIRAFPAGVRDENLPGYEASIQAYSGIMSITGEHDRDPARCGPSVVDMGTGLAATIAVLAALRARDLSGEGAYVEPALLRTATNLLGFHVAGYSLGKVVPQRRGSGHATLVPYGTFHTSDGPILLAASNDSLWAKLWKLLAGDDAPLPFPSLPERVAHRDETNALVQSKILPWKRTALLALLIERGVPAAPVQTLPEYMEDPSLRDARVIERVPLGGSSEIEIAGRLFAGLNLTRERSAPPKLGQQTEEILISLGYDETEREALRRGGAVG